MSSLAELPLEDVLYPYLDTPDSLCALEQTGKSVLSLSRQNGASVWRQMVQRRWGPVELPEAHRWKGWAAKEWEQPPKSWRTLAVFLETVVRPGLWTSVRTTVFHMLLDNGIFGDRHDPESDGRWQRTVHAVLQWGTVAERRRLAAFVCADWHLPHTLSSFLKPLPIVGDTPEAALRALLLRFPFLPIDAGTGADRVISCFARAYAAQNPAAIAALGFDRLGRDDVAVVDSEESTSDEDEALAAAGAARTKITKGMREAVFTLTCARATGGRRHLSPPRPRRCHCHAGPCCRAHHAALSPRGHPRAQTRSSCSTRT